MTTHRKSSGRTPTARELALEALTAIDQEGAYSNLALNDILQRYRPEPREAALATELVYGTIQRRNTIDTVLNRHIAKGLPKLQPWVRSLFRLSAYQLFYLDRIPPHAAVNEAVTIAKRRGHQGVSGLVNAVLRKLAAHPGAPEAPEGLNEVDRIAFIHSHPSWLVREWAAMFGAEKAEAIAKANNEPPKVSIRTNRLKLNREELIARLADDGIEAVPSEVSIDGVILTSGGNAAHSEAYEAGLCTVQDESSMLVAAFADPKPGMRVLDCCAAPGGKTTHLAELMGDRGEIIACDIHPHKREFIEKNAKRLGHTSVQAITADAAKLHERFDAESFDLILLDAPCSGFGVVRRKPDIKWSKTPEDIHAIAELQQTLLESVHRLLKRGGTLVYSTCTLAEAENGEQTARFLAEHPEFSFDAAAGGAVPGKVLERCSAGAGQLLITPADFGSDGFYMARMVRA